VLWSHYELFRGGKASRGERVDDEEGAPSTATEKTSSKKTTLPPPRIHRVVYIDQAPLQNRTPDWSLGSKGCYDAETLAGLQAAVRALDDDDTGGDGGQDDDKNEKKKDAFARGNAEACLSMAIPAELDALLATETNRASGEALARLMADHTRGDWRAVVRGLDAQEALVVAGAESKIFPVEGCRWVAGNAPRAKCVVFRGCGHWLYVERPDEFAGLVARFAVGGLGAVEGGEV
jgi:pimeloyl-ACP methyl ester carboxylesterase